MAKRVVKRTASKPSKSKSTSFKLSPGFRPNNGNKPAFLYVPLPTGFTYKTYSDFKFTPDDVGSSGSNYEVVGSPTVVSSYLEIKFKKKPQSPPGGNSKKLIVAPITGSFTITIEYSYMNLFPSETYELPAIVFDE